MTDNPLTTIQSNTLSNLDANLSQMIIDNLEIALSALSAKNRAEYQRTFQAWSNHVASNGLDPFYLELMAVRDFLIENDWSFNTRKVRLAHLRKFAEILATSDKDGDLGFAFNYGRLALLKPKSLGGNKQVIPTRSLTHKQVYTIFDSLIGDSNQKTRDRAIMGLLLLAGLRASEVVSLKWTNVDFVDNLIYVFEGKGDKSASIPMLDDLPLLLARWRTYQGTFGHYDYVFTTIYRSDKLGADKQSTTRAISTIIKRIVADTGIDFRPHDTRRTAITALLNSGASVPETRDFARHSSGETTLRYAEKSTAKELGSKLKGKLKYGDVLGDMESMKQARYWECSNNHKFHAINPIRCHKCNSTELSYQISLFDD